MWKVLMDGKFLGIIETSYPWASQYWGNKTGFRPDGKRRKYRLVEVYV
jgi:hypothetical protein